MPEKMMVQISVEDLYTLQSRSYALEWTQKQVESLRKELEKEKDYSLQTEKLYLKTVRKLEEK